MKTMAVVVIDRLFLVVYGTEPPTDEEWDAYLKLAERHGIEQTMQLICTDGGEPTAVQRRKLGELVAGRTVPVAVVSDCARVRGSTMLLSWFNRRIRAFPCSQLGKALAYLDLPTSRTDLVARELHRLRIEVAARETAAGARR